MFVRIQNLLQEEHFQFFEQLIKDGTFVAGAATTGEPTRKVKHNLQLDLATHPRREEFLRTVTQLMNENRVVRSAALPKRMTMPMISKYEPGMNYGWHMDNGLMPGVGSLVRTDMACTIFLSDSAAYDGGELLVRSPSGDVTVKLERGDAVLYPATSLHQVTEVTRGERLAIVFWIQSMIADTFKREILYDLELAYDRIMQENQESEAAQAILRAQSNLIRHWTEF